MPTNRKRYMVNIPPGQEAAVKARAQQLNRPVANYLEWLVLRDLEGRADEPHHVQETQETYGAAAEKIQKGETAEEVASAASARLRAEDARSSAQEAAKAGKRRPSRGSRR